MKNFERLKERWMVLAICIAIAVFVPSSLSAQGLYGSVVGTVTDTSGAVVPGATVTITNLGTNQERSAKTDAIGEYRLVNLLPANYKLEIQASSFKGFLQNPVTVQVANTTRVDASLEIGVATETVEVTSAPPLLQTQSGTLGTEVGSETVQAMPLNGRNAMNLVALTPGVVASGNAMASAPLNASNHTQESNWDGYQIGGGFVNENAIYIDGAPVNMLDANASSLIPSQDALQEFKVDSSVPSAEFGRFGGGVIQMTTKSGSNAFHGTVYEYVRNTILNANSFLANNTGLPKTPFHQNQYGAALGGPIKKDKAFFFANWENFALRQGTAVDTNVPTSLQRSGVFSKQITDPSGKCAIQANTPQPGEWTIPSSCFDPSSKVMMGYFPLPNSTVNPNYNFADETEVGDTSYQTNVRVDYNISNKQQALGRYSRWNLDDIGQNPFNNYGGFPTAYSPTHEQTNAIVLGDTYTINPTTVADGRISWTRATFTNAAVGINQVNLSQFGPAYAALSPLVRWKELPEVNMSGPDGIYSMSPVSDVQFEHMDLYSLDASLTKIIKDHTLKFGGEGALRLHNGTGLFKFDNSAFSNSTAGDEVASFMLGEFTTDTIETAQPSTTFNYYWAFYGNDTWRVTHTLTVNMGLSWALPGGLAEKKDSTTVLLPNTVDPVTGDIGAVVLVNSALYHSRSEEPLHYALFAPRVSFAQSLPGSSVIRGGYGISYLPPDMQDASMAYFSPVNAGITTSRNGAVPTYFESDPFPDPAYPNDPTHQSILEPAGRTNPNFSATLLGKSVTAPVPTNRFPYMQMWNLSIGKQWKGDWLTEISYAGAKGTDLPINAPVGLDQVPDSAVGPAGTVGPLQTMENNLIAGGSTTTQAQSKVIAYADTLLPYPQFQNLLNAEQNTGNSTYNAMYLVLRKQFRSRGLISANYTWDKLLTNTDSPNNNNNISFGGSELPQDYYNTKSDKSIAGIEVPRRLVVSYLLNLPFGKGQRFGATAQGVAGALISGWAANGIVQVQSGLPLVMTYNGNNLTKNLNAGTLRPNYVAGCNRQAGVPGSVYQRFKQNNWFNAACFTYPGDFSFGNEPRVDPVLHTQGLTDFDFSLSKATPVKDSVSLMFAAEAFDIFNHPYFGNIGPGTQMAGSSYNQIPASTASTNGRLVQLSLRLNF